MKTLDFEVSTSIFVSILPQKGVYLIRPHCSNNSQ